MALFEQVWPAAKVVVEGLVTMRLDDAKQGSACYVEAHHWIERRFR